MKLFTLVAALLLIGIMGITAVAQGQVIAPAGATSSIWTRGAFGNGLAISQSDPMDFELIRVGIAGVRIAPAVSAAAAENVSVVKVGILYFGETKYRLRNVVIGNGSASADINLNDTRAGTISVDSYVKGDREVWAGTLTLDGETYNAYIIQVPKVLNSLEKARRIHDYCKNNPVRCRAAMNAVGNIICDPGTDSNCRDRIRDFCEQNPDDNRCKALRIADCRTNTEDADCRAELMGVCQNDATENACNVLGEVYNKNIEKRPEALTNAPRWFITVRNRIQQQQLQPQANVPGATGGA